jgi:opacity protein-like surface antigen
MLSKYIALAGAAALLSTAAVAADLPPPPVYPVPVVAVGGWYLRGDVGVAQKRLGDFAPHPTNPDFVWPASWRIDQKDMADAAFVGFGVGYAWSS